MAWTDMSAIAWTDMSEYVVEAVYSRHTAQPAIDRSTDRSISHNTAYIHMRSSESLPNAPISRSCCAMALKRLC